MCLLTSFSLSCDVLFAEGNLPRPSCAAKTPWAFFFIAVWTVCFPMSSVFMKNDLHTRILPSFDGKEYEYDTDLWPDERLGCDEVTC